MVKPRKVDERKAKHAVGFFNSETDYTENRLVP